MILLFLYELVHQCLSFDGIISKLNEMECLKILAVGIFFVLRISHSQPVSEEAVPPVLKEYINNEMRRIEKVFTNKVEKLVEMTRNENMRLSRENNLLIMKLYKERRNNFKQICELKNELKDAEKHFMHEMKGFKDLTVTELLEKTREIDALKDEIRLVKLASELSSGQVKRIYNKGDNSDQEKSEKSETTFRRLGNMNNLGRGALKDENGGSWNIGPSFNGPCDTCNDKHSMLFVFPPYLFSSHMLFLNDNPLLTRLHSKNLDNP